MESSASSYNTLSQNYYKYDGGDKVKAQKLVHFSSKVDTAIKVTQDRWAVTAVIKQPDKLLGSFYRQTMILFEGVTPRGEFFQKQAFLKRHECPRVTDYTFLEKNQPMNTACGSRAIITIEQVPQVGEEATIKKQGRTCLREAFKVDELMCKIQKEAEKPLEYPVAYHHQGQNHIINVATIHSPFVKSMYHSNPSFVIKSFVYADHFKYHLNNPRCNPFNPTATIPVYEEGEPIPLNTNNREQEFSCSNFLDVVYDGTVGRVITPLAQLVETAITSWLIKDDERSFSSNMTRCLNNMETVNLTDDDKVAIVDSKNNLKKHPQSVALSAYITLRETIQVQPIVTHNEFSWVKENLSTLEIRLIGNTLKSDEYFTPINSDDEFESSHPKIVKERKSCSLNADDSSMQFAPLPRGFKPSPSRKKGKDKIA